MNNDILLKRMKVCFIGAEPSSLVNFRGELIRSIIDNGHVVIAMASGAKTSEIDAVESLGTKYIDYSVQRNGLNPLSDLKTLLSLLKILKVEKPGQSWGQPA